MKRKKITAILLASLMGISAVPATTWAADSYKETEKAAFAKMIEEFGADYAKSLSEMDTEEVKGNAEIKVSLEGFVCGKNFCFIGHRWNSNHFFVTGIVRIFMGY